MCIYINMYMLFSLLSIGPFSVIIFLGELIPHFAELDVSVKVIKLICV